MVGQHGRRKVGGEANGI
jgi:hypothetical protein